MKTHARPNAFTLVEMIVAIAVLALLVVILAQLFTGASTTITTSRKHMDADSEARLTFNRIGADIAGILRSPQLDSIFCKLPNTSDGFFFYSQAAGYYDNSLYPGNGASDPKSPVSLIGYRIDTNPTFHLDRLSKGLTWDNQGNLNSATSAYNTVVFLAPASGGAGWEPSTLLSGAFPAAVGPPPYYPGTPGETDNQALAPDVFRLEICFLLKDGTLSDQPISSTTPSGWGTGTYYTSSGSAPDSTKGYPNYVAGSRWALTGNGTEPQYFICTGAPTSGMNATWGPLGLQDVSALIVTIAVLDPNSQKLLGATTLGDLNPLFPDSGFSPAVPANTAVLPGAAWQAKITQPTFASTAHIPQIVAGQIRVYQRFFYLSTSTP